MAVTASNRLYEAVLSHQGAEMAAFWKLKSGSEPVELLAIELIRTPLSTEKKPQRKQMWRSWELETSKSMGLFRLVIS